MQPRRPFNQFIEVGTKMIRPFSRVSLRRHSRQNRHRTGQHCSYARHNKRLSSVWRKITCCGLLLAGRAIADPLSEPDAGVPGAGASRTAVLPTIQVTGQTSPAPYVGLVGKRAGIGTKTDVPIREIPQTTNVITAEQIEETGSSSVGDALRYMPGFSAYSVDTRTDWLTGIRGFAPNVFVDGMQVPSTELRASWRVDPYMIDSISVLRGPASALYGPGQPGALVDIQSKLADGERYRETGFQIGNYARKQFMFDLGSPIDKARSLSYRFVGVLRDGNMTTGPNGQQRISLAPSFRWQPDANTSIVFDATYLQDHGDWTSNYLPAAGTVLPNPNGKVPYDLYTGDPSLAHYAKKQWSIGYALDHTFSPDMSFRQKVRYLSVSLDTAALWGQGLAPLDPTRSHLKRLAELSQPHYNRMDVDNTLQTRFGAGPTEHTVLFGLEYDRQRSTDSDWSAPGPDLNLFDPVYGIVSPDIFSGPGVRRLSDRTTLDDLGVYAQDQIKWGRLALTVGGRYDWNRVDEDALTRGTHESHTDAGFSERVGLTFEGPLGLSPFVDYSTSFNPSQSIVTLSNGSTAAPNHGRQVEAGLRWEVPHKNMMLTADVYQIEQTNVLVPDPNDPLHQQQTGKVKSRGIEFSAVGRLSRNLSIIASYAYQDVKNAGADDRYAGKWPTTYPLPRQLASAWLDWTWHGGALGGWGWGAGIRYQSDMPGNAANTLVAPSYTVLDTAIHYDSGRWAFALNVNNLLDRHFIGSCQSDDRCFYGDARTVLATAKYDW